MATKKKSTVNSSGNYTKPGMRKRLFNSKNGKVVVTKWVMVNYTLEKHIQKLASH